MVHTRWGVSQLRAAEVRRGCIFSESLDSVDSVLKNGGVIGSGAKFVSPKEGFRFDGTANGKITYGDMLRQNLSAITISLWVKYKTVPAMASLVGQAVSAIDRTEVYTNAGDLFFYVCVSGTGRYAQQSSTNVTDGNWHHITGTWYSGSYVRLYVDGVLVASSAATHTGTITVASAVKDFTIGSWPNGGYPLDGNIRGMMVFNTALDADEIAAYYNGSMFRYDDYCVCDLPMRIQDHEISNVRTMDRSGQMNHAIFGDGVTSTTYPTKLTSSIGYSGDGGDYLRTPLWNGKVIDSTTKLTFGCLAKYPTLPTGYQGAISCPRGASGTNRLYAGRDAAGVFKLGVGNTAATSTFSKKGISIDSFIVTLNGLIGSLYIDSFVTSILTRTSDVSFTCDTGFCAMTTDQFSSPKVAVSILGMWAYDGIVLNCIQRIDKDIRAKECLSKC